MHTNLALALTARHDGTKTGGKDDALTAGPASALEHALDIVSRLAVFAAPFDWRLWAVTGGAVVFSNLVFWRVKSVDDAIAADLVPALLATSLSQRRGIVHLGAITCRGSGLRVAQHRVLLARDAHTCVAGLVGLHRRISHSGGEQG